ncbi:hypothetical protein [Nostoc sp. DSM 114160]
MPDILSLLQCLLPQINATTMRRKDSGGRVLTKGTLGVEYHNHQPQRASTNRPGKS